MNNKKLLYALAFLVGGCILFLLTMTFSPLFTGTFNLFIRIALAVITGIITYMLYKKRGRKDQFQVSMAFFLAALAILLAGIIVHPCLELLNINIATPEGIAIAKLLDAGIISLTIIIPLCLVRKECASIYLQRGKLGLGLIIGIGTFLLMGALAIGQATQTGTSIDEIMNWTPWILIFVLANGFMEELLFRGLFLKRFAKLIGPGLSIAVTTIVFTLAHMQVTYVEQLWFFMGVVLVLAILWALVIYKTDSLLGAVLFHAGADIMVILPIFAGQSMQLG